MTESRRYSPVSAKRSAGPFSVKQHGGRRRVRKGEYPTVPQYQVSKGRLIVTAALELSTNQVTHFYSDKKDSGENARA
jgi:hypothetical protein